MTKIGIIGAMDEEVQQLKDQLDPCQEKVIAGSHFYQGLIAGQDVILLKSGIGKVNAALATTILLSHFQPDVVINTGSAGGFNQDLEVGDIVVSTEVRYHDVDATVFGHAYGQVPQMPAAYKADERLMNLAEYVAKEETNAHHTVKGLIATGDSFMSDPSRVAFVLAQFPDLQAAEMEAGAIAQVCYKFETPFVIIRSLSDIAGKEAPASFNEFLQTAATHSATLILTMIKELKGFEQSNEN
ncbi:5'-methylthioadenosine/S-adenosylhomocysteine nucleosidase [Lentibacillus kapialis]|uniref:5'-methylthioadenosine/S-adenosylhomocysteine nucleosidase n=1 Tax=Lentibacillus kapialis TaxID=340214 RepID=A0A917PJN8_9BACI|nr:5'-methylthioadenosine/S-adenosylhomocysteine nucleosidase [Lentibacillus kapialis]GGJ82041.1 5'-methylthioadenosine/S-adenosylhomocysteine nucleosidase [Lentibacillus kapialis]